MTKSIDTLVKDIYSVVEGKGGWTEAINEHYAGLVSKTMMDRLGDDDSKYSNSGLRMSNLGETCPTRLWYMVNEPDGGEGFQPHTRMKFLYGDILEDLLLALAIAAGHDVQGEQDVMEAHGIKGRRDAVIDGRTVDVKSASTYGFQKFRDGTLREDDPFNYIGQLSTYVYAAQNDPLVTDKTRGSFLAFDKQNGHICLDTYDFTNELKYKEKQIEDKKALIAGPKPDYRVPDEPFQKGGNRKLSIKCSYCDRKTKCWPEMRTFLYSTKPEFLTKVVKEPKVQELIR